MGSMGGGVNSCQSEALWEAFEAKAQEEGEITLLDIPFPTDASSYLRVGQKDFKKLAMRWHPDKFMQRFGTKLRAAQKEDILNQVKATFQQVNAAR